MSKEEKIIEGARTAFINSDFHSNLAYRPEFITNNYKEGKKVLSSIEDELLRCDRFQISVAFITESGLTPLLLILRELEEKGIPGQILTTNYLNFSEPKALKKLSEFKNITIKLYDAEGAGEGFHTKGYIFKKDEIYRIIIGSSNLTKTALSTNKEWNTKFVSSESGEMAKEVLNEFNDLWNSKYSLSFEDFYEDYKEKYEIVKKQREIAKEEKITSIEKYRLQPNSMQVGFIKNLKALVEEGEDRALLISATGTGKTYASAFAMRELGFKRVLFVVHRAQLAKQTRKSYGRVFSNKVSMGFIGDGKFDCDSEYLFATVQTLNKDEYLNRFNPEDFDCIILDEAHHSSAGSYQRIMNYFKPKLFLGMTATPDKRDDNIEGRNIYEIFNHNIVYEIRLQQAMQEDLLCPFHYFGITDLSLIGDLKTGKKLSERDFNLLTSDERINHIIKQANYFGYSGDRVKGLIFCSRINEAEALSEKFNSTINPETGRYFRTISLDGSASAEQRQEAFERLAMDENDGSGREPLDYIFSVEILNEGVDIVEVNQVIMLRPTQSPIVFVQQLGRGLRKADGKEFVVIIDFIGNYNNNFMIPIALSGDRTYNKDNIRRYIREGDRILPGASTVHFDEISRRKIYESIDRMSTTKKMLTEKYFALKERLGKIPSVLDFYNEGEIDPLLFIDYSRTYDQFVRMVDEDYKVKFTDEQEAILEFISANFVNGKRIHELLMLKMLLERDFITKESFKNELERYGETFSDADYESSYSIISKQFLNTQSEAKRYQTVDVVYEKEDRKGSINRTLTFASKLSEEFFRKELSNLITLGIEKNRNEYAEHDRNNLVLYQKYSRKDVCRILNWKKDDSQTMYGYRIKYNTCPIFVTYEKSDDISKSTQYADEFERLNIGSNEYSNRIFSWMTRSKVRETSTEAQAIIHAEEENTKVLLFMKKSDGEGTDFYYMGEALPRQWKETTILNDKGESLPIMNFKLELKDEVRKDIFDYFVG